MGVATAGLEEFLDDVERYLTPEAANVLVFSYAAHHCYRPSLLRLIEDAVLQERLDAIYILDATAEHGWTKVYYMPLDCGSPEDFRNITLTGRWQSHTLWQEPFKPLEHSAVSRAWCALRRLTPPHGGAALSRGAAAERSAHGCGPPGTLNDAPTRYASSVARLVGEAWSCSPPRTHYREGITRYLWTFWLPEMKAMLGQVEGR